MQEFWIFFVANMEFVLKNCTKEFSLSINDFRNMKNILLLIHSALIVNALPTIMWYIFIVLVSFDNLFEIIINSI